MTRITVRIDLAPGSHLGHGKIRLLELVERHGSIAAAARAMGMSYRRAWLLCDEVNRMFLEPAIGTKLGGKGGGKAELTSFGQEIVALYRDVEAQSLGLFGERLERLQGQLAQTKGGDGSPEPQERL